MFPATYHVPAAVLLLLGGLLSCFAGNRLFRLVLGIYGFVAGALLTSTVMGAGDPKSTMLAMLIGGIIGAVILVLAYFVGVALIGAALGAIVIHLIWAQLGHEPHPAWVIVGTVAGALGALALQKVIIILATAFAGSWTALVGGLYLAHGQTGSTPEGWILYPLRPPPGQDWMWLAWIVIGVLGVAVQIGMRARSGIKTKKKRAAA
jgi:hypothetical protein